jgi:hypothetical protein
MRYQYFADANQLFADSRPCLHEGFLPSVSRRSGRVEEWKNVEGVNPLPPNTVVQASERMAAIRPGDAS